MADVSGDTYGPPWWLEGPWLGLLAMLGIVAVCFCVFLLVITWAEERKRRQDARDFARTMYEEWVHRLHQCISHDGCDHATWTSVVQTVEAWQKFKAVDPKHCPLEPDIPEVVLAKVEAANRLCT